MDKEKFDAGLAWLRATIAGDASPLTAPADALQAIHDLAQRHAPGSVRDPDAPLPETVDVQLKNPFDKVAGGGEKVTKVVFRTPSWSDLKEIARIERAGDEIGAAHAMLVRLNQNDLTGPDIDRMKGIDAQRCAEVLRPFLSLA